MNKTFVSMLEDLGYDIEITYVKRNEKQNVMCKRGFPLMNKGITIKEFNLLTEDQKINLMKELHEADESEKMESYLLENSNFKKNFL